MVREMNHHQACPYYSLIKLFRLCKNPRKMMSSKSMVLQGSSFPLLLVQLCRFIFIFCVVFICGVVFYGVNFIFRVVLNLGSFSVLRLFFFWRLSQRLVLCLVITIGLVLKFVSKQTNRLTQILSP